MKNIYIEGNKKNLEDAVGDLKEIDGINLISKGSKKSLSMDTADFVLLGISVVSNIGIGLITNILYDLLKKGYKIRINNKEINNSDDLNHEIENSDNK